jgi:DNA-binding beta-propeller fold protein YncE
LFIENKDQERINVASITESSGPRRAFTAFAGILALALAAVLWAASSAPAAELIYWNNWDGDPDTIGFASIDGSGGGAQNLAGAPQLESPEGMAYDPVTNRLFVTNAGGPGNGQITAINLDGSGAASFTAPGAPIEEPEGVVVDPVARTIFWANNEGAPDGSIAWARLDGSTGGALNTTGATLNNPYKIGFDPVAGRVYWANSGSATEVISFANANNSGGGDLNTAGAPPLEGITGFSVDPAGNRIYWSENEPARVSFAALSGGNGGTVSLAGAVVNEPYGLAFDPSIGRFYWGNYGNGTTTLGAIGFANLAGGGGGINFLTAPVEGPQDPVVLKSPSGTGAPAVTRSTKSRSSLSCTAGSWAADFAGSFVYQSPRTLAYQWTRNGAAITGATVATFVAKSPGQYACQVTATNHAGAATQASAAAKVKAAKVKLSTKKKATAKAGGVAKFKVKGVNQGDLQSKKARVCTKLSKGAKGVLKAPKCKTLGKLKGRGKDAEVLKIKVDKSADPGTYKVTFTVKGSPGKPAKAKVIVKP